MPPLRLSLLQRSNITQPFAPSNQSNSAGGNLSTATAYPSPLPPPWHTSLPPPSPLSPPPPAYVLPTFLIILGGALTFLFAVSILFGCTWLCLFCWRETSSGLVLTRAARRGRAEYQSEQGRNVVVQGQNQSGQAQNQSGQGQGAPPNNPGLDPKVLASLPQVTFTAKGESANSTSSQSLSPFRLWPAPQRTVPLTSQTMSSGSSEGAPFSASDSDGFSKEAAEEGAAALPVFRECSICLSDYVDGDLIKWLPECGHDFHGCCIDEWLMAKGTCPVCRRKVGPTIGESSAEGLPENS